MQRPWIRMHLASLNDNRIVVVAGSEKAGRRMVGDKVREAVGT